MKLNREKVSHAVRQVTMALTAMQFSPDETIAFIKCLDNVFRAQAIEKDLVVASKIKLMEVINGRERIETLFPDGVG